MGDIVYIEYVYSFVFVLDVIMGDIVYIEYVYSFVFVLDVMKYLIRLDYACDEIEPGKEEWFVVESEVPVEIGSIGPRHEYALLEPHNCGKDLYSQACQEDIYCTMQKILDVEEFSVERVRELGLGEVVK